MRGRGAWWQERFDQMNVRVTTARGVVLTVLQESAEHLSAADIYVKAHALRPDIGLTTVYRTLDILEQMGLLHKIDVGDGRARYELKEGREGKGRHCHLICVKCRKIIDCTDLMKEDEGFSEEILAKTAEKYHFEITDQLVSFYGICDRCRLLKPDNTQ